MTLRAVAAWIESHPEAEVSRITFDPIMGEGFEITAYGVTSAQDLVARAVRLGGRWEKNAEDYGLFTLSQEVVPGVKYRLVANRDDVCERVQVGEETVTEPDPEAVAALPKVERTVPVYEWKCEPLFSARERAA